ncbi:hypothetical protein GYMLUDRAFT_923933 [Collybiopsis luxurians FD-317 M1]|uniref:Uncharacterized protein n=1 Tax=Collybiopsis luxurians FD-317 M1 TaxID=944289 RepID=A0A0D0BGK7_9AGAR|nr:hypothetical protein GYMLUDRAFT_923933 [Collybiopsis luxurians FD-317 M1]
MPDATFSAIIRIAVLMIIYVWASWPLSSRDSASCHRLSDSLRSESVQSGMLFEVHVHPLYVERITAHERQPQNTNCGCGRRPGQNVNHICGQE